MGGDGGGYGYGVCMGEGMEGTQEGRYAFLTFFTSLFLLR